MTLDPVRQDLVHHVRLDAVVRAAVLTPHPLPTRVRVVALTMAAIITGGVLFQPITSYIFSTADHLVGFLT